MHINSRSRLGVLALALGSTKAMAVDVNAGDYTALPAGTNVAAWYQRYSHSDRFNADGGADSTRQTSLNPISAYCG
ncbi:hypothetical protein [Pseudomonas syringae]|uniref:hypothetical protein n=1 Tax=Pseudomonas syringae TaxID=317 RepID=UPI000A84DFE0|nr:hypothetical protein [Pseudomonas syringae]